ncbi:MAG: M48 family metallopeptidase [Proteobacteria bacterium]|nr:M48 family metallopeptidase [Pseudomonadota bacterium]
MNYIAVIILITVLADFILHTFADYLNLKNLTSELPYEFSDIYDSEKYIKAQEYLKTNTRFGWMSSSFDMIILLIFWFGKGFIYLDLWVKSLKTGAVFSGLIYIGILLLLKALISLPFSIYDTFVIEERFGFNKTTPITFISDIFKGLFLTILLGGPLLAGILYFFEWAGAGAWLYCWILSTLFILILQFIAPVWIMPLFNRFEPLEEGKLKDAIVEYARSIGFSLKNIYVMDGSKRSGKANAFFTGFGKSKRIVLFDTLIEKQSVSELIAVIAHEMGHYRKKHILQGVILGIIKMGLMFFLLSLFISYQGLFDAFYMQDKSVYAGLVFFGMLYVPLDFFTGILTQMFSRKNEYEADRFAVETTGDSNSLITALKKLSVENLSNLVPHPLYVFLNYSHPPLLNRIRALSL